MWTKDHKRSDANHVAWINLIQSNTTHCAKLGLMRVQKSYTDASSAQMTAPRPLWVLLISRFEKTEWVGFVNPLQSPEERTQLNGFRNEEFREKVQRIADFLPEQI